MNPDATYQWTRDGQWYRGRMAIVDDAPFCLYPGDEQLMLTLPSHDLTFVCRDDLELAPEPGVPGKDLARPIAKGNP